MSQPFKVGLIGCGTVGQGVVRILQAEAGEIEKKTGVRLELARVIDKDLSQPRKVNVTDDRVSTDAADVFNDKRIKAPHPLEKGDRIRIGRTIYKFTPGRS